MVKVRRDLFCVMAQRLKAKDGGFSQGRDLWVGASKAQCRAPRDPQPARLSGGGQEVGDRTCPGKGIAAVVTRDDLKHLCCVLGGTGQRADMRQGGRGRGGKDRNLAKLRLDTGKAGQGCWYPDRAATIGADCLGHQPAGRHRRRTAA